MVDLTHRSYQHEKMDEPDIPKEIMFQTLRELEVINQLLGGHAITLSGLKKLMTDKSKTYSIADFGCGGGDTLKVIAKWAEKHNFSVQLTGIDYNADCIEYASQLCKDIPNIQFIQSDFYGSRILNMKFDIVICALFCHHQNDEQLNDYLNLIWKTSSVGIVINDLHRHWFAFYSIKLLTCFLSKSPLVKNDASLSVHRSFRKKEWEIYFGKTEIKSFNIQWKWAFRWLVTAKK